MLETPVHFPTCYIVPWFPKEECIIVLVELCLDSVSSGTPPAYAIYIGSRNILNVSCAGTCLRIFCICRNSKDSDSLSRAVWLICNLAVCRISVACELGLPENFIWVAIMMEITVFEFCSPFPELHQIWHTTTKEEITTPHNCRDLKACG